MHMILSSFLISWLLHCTLFNFIAISTKWKTNSIFLVSIMFLANRFMIIFTWFLYRISFYRNCDSINLFHHVSHIMISTITAIIVVAYPWKICEILWYNLLLFHFYLLQMWRKFVCQSRLIFWPWWGFEGKWIIQNSLREKSFLLRLFSSKTRFEIVITIRNIYYYFLWNKRWHVPSIIMVFYLSYWKLNIKHNAEIKNEIQNFLDDIS